MPDHQTAKAALNTAALGKPAQDLPTAANDQTPISHKVAADIEFARVRNAIANCPSEWGIQIPAKEPTKEIFRMVAPHNTQQTTQQPQIQQQQLQRQNNENTDLKPTDYYSPYACNFSTF